MIKRRIIYLILFSFLNLCQMYINWNLAGIEFSFKNSAWMYLVMILNHSISHILVFILLKKMENK